MCGGSSQLVGSRIRKKSHVPASFDIAANSYDRLTSLNPGYHKHLRCSARRLGAPRGARILDLCCGTGSSSAALLAARPDALITGLDASAEMLARARQRSGLGRVRWLHGDAMDPATSGAVGPYDAIFMAYGIRNMPDVDTCLHNLRELLVAGAPICFHEYSVADSRVATLVWKAVSRAIIRPSAYLATRSTELFRYLEESVIDFDGVADFKARLARAGFAEIRALPMDGWQRGIVHSFLAQRPHESV